MAKISQATHTGTRGGVVVDGLDAVVTDFALRAARIPAAAGVAVVAAAKQAAGIQRSLVPIDEGDLLDSITADDRPTIDGAAVYADAGPDTSVNPGGFKGHLIERGTVDTPPFPFVGPSADETMPSFEKALRALA